MDTAKPPIVTRTHRSRQLWWWLIVGLLAVLIVVLGWLLWQARQELSETKRDKDMVQSQLDAVATVTKESSKPTDAPPAVPPATPPCYGTVPVSTKDAITTALDTKTYAPLQPLMTPSVNVVFAASEKGGGVPAAQAVIDLRYLNSSMPPWNFALPAATVASYQASFYGPYFAAGRYIGKSADNIVASFGFDTCGKIEAIFIGAEDVL